VGNPEGTETPAPRNNISFIEEMPKRVCVSADFQVLLGQLMLRAFQFELVDDLEIQQSILDHRP
jgi:hypothetical protein